MKYYQQGDVVIEQIEELVLTNKHCKKVKLRNLADGETTGHAHRVIEGEATMFEDGSGALYMKAETPCKIGHEEHKQITIEAGVYKIGIVKEFDPFSEEIRSVRD